MASATFDTARAECLQVRCEAQVISRICYSEQASGMRVVIH
jgi:hypothetical protein